MHFDFHFGAALSVILLAIASTSVSVSAQTDQELPDCSVRLLVSEQGRPVPEWGRRLRHEDTLAILGADTTMNHVVTVANRGKTEQFDVVIEGVTGLSVTAGGGTRSIMAKTGKTGSLGVTVRGGGIDGKCQWGSRSISVIAKPAGGTKVCGQVEKRFFCPPQKKSAAGM